ncbi:50S ribosomal protein L3 N(5)-glutamine methyltransferase [Permianibacter sp. IMCC34836]|nr:50S ribosomal protein L3 N(5)-glutamine methyltransferase [Permianibacter fluminis]
MSEQDIQQAVDDLHTAQDFWRWAASRFAAHDLFYGHGTINAWDEAGALVMQSLDLPHEYIREIASCRLTRSERELIANRAAERINSRRPLPYITGKAYFCGLEFIVDESVLIPRSPIAELIQNRFQPWLGEREPARILDLCCGSACIAIACAHAFPEALIDASDISAEALDVAEENVAAYQLEEQVQLVQSDGLTELMDEQYDLIVCNPPYVDAEDFASVPPEYRHEPALALAAGEDGLDFVRQLLADAAKCLTPGGLLICEVGNSMRHVMAQYPNVPFTWLEFEHSDDGVFLISREELRQFFPS